MKIDDELKGCAAVALQNAFYTDLASLVAKYRAAAAGLGSKPGLGEDVETGSAFVEIHTWGDNPDGTLVEHDKLNLYGQWPTTLYPGAKGSCGYANFVEAFEDDRAQEIWIDGTKLFERHEDGEWYVAPEKEKP